MNDETEFVLVIRHLPKERLKPLMALTKALGDKRLILDHKTWDDFETELVKMEVE